MFVPAQDPLTSIEDGIRALMTSRLDLFVGMGLNLFRGFATILIVWFGVQSALSSAEGGEGFNFARFTRLLLVIAFGFAMVKYYTSPIPGIGQSFPDLVMQEASSLSNSIGLDQGRLIETRVTEVEQGMEQPNSFSFHETLTFVVLVRDPGRCSGGRADDYRFRLDRSGGTFARRTIVRSVFHCAEDGLALLGLVQSVSSVFVLSSGGKCICIYLRQAPAGLFRG